MYVIRKDLIYPELSYKINGILFEVFRGIGFGYKEFHYQRAITILFKKYKVNFIEQYKVPLYFNGTEIGFYKLDFLIEDIIILEIKQGDYFRRENIKQILDYLKMKNLKLGLLANFTSKGVKTKRILNL